MTDWLDVKQCTHVGCLSSVYPSANVSDSHLSESYSLVGWCMGTQFITSDFDHLEDKSCTCILAEGGHSMPNRSRKASTFFISLKFDMHATPSKKTPHTNFQPIMTSEVRDTGHLRSRDSA